jgi:hypothetical protein
MAAAQGKRQIALDVVRLEDIAAKGGSIEAKLLARLRDGQGDEGSVLLCFPYEVAKEFLGQFQGKMIVAKTQIGRS